MTNHIVPLYLLKTDRTNVFRPFGEENTHASNNIDAGWSSPVARQAHNLKVVGSNPTPATIKKALNSMS